MEGVLWIGGLKEWNIDIGSELASVRTKLKLDHLLINDRITL